jgi:hypothetical protein
MNAAWKLIPVTAAIALLSACGTRTTHTREVIREQPVIAQQPAAPVASTVTIVQAPPPQSETPTPQPGPGYSWVAGHHEFRNGAWVWVPGQWIAGTVRPMPSPITEPPPAVPSGESSRWVPGYWSFNGSDWVWVRGRWM